MNRSLSKVIIAEGVCLCVWRGGSGAGYITRANPSASGQGISRGARGCLQAALLRLAEILNWGYLQNKGCVGTDGYAGRGET